MDRFNDNNGRAMSDAAAEAQAIQESVMDRILDERKRQDAKWGVQDHDEFMWLAILTEEVGEVAQSSLFAMEETRESNLKQELTQVAAVAVAWLEAIERRAAARADDADAGQEGE